MHVCVGTCTDQKWVTTLGQLQGIFNWQLIVVCICERARECEWLCMWDRKRMWGTSASLYWWSLPHFSLLSLLYHPFFLPLFPLLLPLHLCVFSGGIWLHHGQLGLRSSHNDWRIVHLQPQGGGPHLPGLPRWHWVCFKGASCCNVPKFLWMSCRWRRSCGGEQLILKGWQRIMFLFLYVCFLVSSKTCLGNKTKPGLPNLRQRTQVHS